MAGNEHLVLVADDTVDMSILQPAKFNPLVVAGLLPSFLISHGSSDSISALLKSILWDFSFQSITDHLVRMAQD